MDSKPKTSTARVLRDFTDAGTGTGDTTAVERRFIKGDEVQLTPGELENFAACGLVERVADQPVETVLDPKPDGEPESEGKKPARRG